ncbi:hypothetical protein [Haemophilus paracuniculus]|nr:hypothetical protein [Haemophilus paracuniculus]
MWFTLCVFPLISPQDDFFAIGSKLKENWVVPVCGLIYIGLIIAIHRDWHRVGNDKYKIIVLIFVAILFLCLPQWYVMFKVIGGYKIFSDIKYFVMPLVWFYINLSIYMRLVAISKDINKLSPPKK